MSNHIHQFGPDYLCVCGATPMDALEVRIQSLEAALRDAKRPHRHVDEDCWFCCSAPHTGGWPDDLHTTCDDVRAGQPCDCGADAFNAKIDAVLTPARPVQERQA